MSRFLVYIGGSEKSLRGIATEKRARRYGLSASALFQKLEHMAKTGMLKGRDGSFRESEVLETMEKCARFLRGQIHDLREMQAELDRMKADPDELEAMGRAVGTPAIAPKEPEDARAGQAEEPGRAAVDEAEGQGRGPAQGELPEAPAPKVADEGGMDAARAALLRKEVSALLEINKPGDYLSQEEFVLAILYELERKGVVHDGDGRQPESPRKGPYFVEMLPMAQYLPIRTGQEFAQFEQDVFRAAEKIADGSMNGLITHDAAYSALRRILQEPGKMQLGKAFVTKWTRRMAKDMHASEFRPLEQDRDYMITAAGLRAVSTSMCRIICAAENLAWSDMRRYLPARVPARTLAAPVPEGKGKRAYVRMMDRKHYFTLDGAALVLRTRALRQEETLQILKGLEADGVIGARDGKYRRKKVDAKFEEFRKAHWTRGEIASRISREFGVGAAPAMAKFSVLCERHADEAAALGKYGLYEREGIIGLIAKHADMLRKHSRAGKQNLAGGGKRGSDCWDSLESAAKGLKSRSVRTGAALGILAGLEQEGKIARGEQGYQKGAVEEALLGFLRTHVGEADAVGMVAREFGLCGATAKKKLDEFAAAHPSEIGKARKHGFYSSEAFAALLKGCGAEFGRERAKRGGTAHADAERERRRRGKLMMKGALGTAERFMGISGKLKETFEEETGISPDELFGKFRRSVTLGGIAHVFTAHEFETLTGLGEMLASGKMKAIARGFKPEEIKNLARVARARLMRTGRPVETGKREKRSD